MEDINKRIRELRTSLGMSQEEFGKILKISKSGVCDLESGRRKVQEAHIIMLKNWNEKSINEHWIRTGEGEIFKELSFDSILSEISFGEDEFIKDFIEVYFGLDSSSKKALKEIMYKMSEKAQKRKGN